MKGGGGGGGGRRDCGNGNLIVVYGAAGADGVAVMPTAKCNAKGGADSRAVGWTCVEREGGGGRES